MKHVLSIDQFDKPMLEQLCQDAEQHEFNVSMGHVGTVGRSKVLANLFYEPSTRTSSSFYSAMVRLGGSVIPINNVQYSSVAKGETLEDTIRTMQCYAEVIVLRHPEEGAAMRAATVSSVPIINAGDGANEHPTQALLDFYTIQKSFQTLDKLHIVMMGDLLRGRTVKSLSKLLRNYNIKISWVAPRSLQINESYVAEGEVITDDLSSVIGGADVVYLTRAQNERMSGWGFEAVPEHELVYGITPEHMAQAPEHLLLLHPLPRTSELPVEIDTDHRAAYFRQMRNGLFMRMTVIANVLS